MKKEKQIETILHFQITKHLQFCFALPYLGKTQFIIIFTKMNNSTSAHNANCKKEAIKIHEMREKKLIIMMMIIMKWKIYLPD